MRRLLLTSLVALLIPLLSMGQLSTYIMYTSPNQTASVAFGSRIAVFTSPVDGLYEISTNVRISTTTATSGTIQPTVDIGGAQQFNPASLNCNTAGMQATHVMVQWLPSTTLVSWYASDTQAGGTANYITRISIKLIGT